MTCVFFSFALSLCVCVFECGSFVCEFKLFSLIFNYCSTLKTFTCNFVSISANVCACVWVCMFVYIHMWLWVFVSTAHTQMCVRQIHSSTNAAAAIAAVLWNCLHSYKCRRYLGFWYNFLICQKVFHDTCVVVTGFFTLHSVNTTLNINRDIYITMYFFFLRVRERF